MTFQGKSIYVVYTWYILSESLFHIPGIYLVHFGISFPTQYVLQQNRAGVHMHTDLGLQGVQCSSQQQETHRPGQQLPSPRPPTRTRRQKPEHRASPHSHFFFFGACFFGLTGPGGLPALPAGDAAARTGDAAARDAASAGVVPRLAPASLELAATLLESSSLAPPASASSSAAAMSPALSSSLAPVAVLVSSAASSSLALAPPRTLAPSETGQAHR